MIPRKAFFWLHLGVGLAAGAFLASMAVSGILMAFAPQILAWSERSAARAVSPEGPRRELAELLSAAAEATPDGKPSGFTLRRDPASAALVDLGENGVVYVDPRSGSVLGHGSPAREFFEGVEHWHRWLGSRKFGKPFTDAAALGLVILSLSGLWLWRPRTRSGAKAALARRRELRGRARARNSHNAIGFWSSPLLLVLALTGSVMAYRWAGNLLFTLTGGQSPKEEAAEGRNGTKPGNPGMIRDAGRRDPAALGNLHVSLDSLAAWAGSKAPAWKTLTLRTPRGPGGAWSGSVEEPGFAYFQGRSRFSLDGETGAITGWQPFAEQPTGRKLRMWTMPLHTGRGLGWPGQALAALAAIALLSQIWTGGRMAWRRFSRRAGAAGRVPQGPGLHQVPDQRSTANGLAMDCPAIRQSRD